MVTQGVLAVDPAVSIAIQQSRYQEPVQIPSVAELKAILQAADQLANHKLLDCPGMGALSPHDLPRR
jgi:hypothetical protein